MATSLRTKLILGYLPLLLGLMVLGLWAIALFSRLGGQIAIILQENYRSIVAAERMKEALERQDSAFQFTLIGEGPKARHQYTVNRPIFEHYLDVERHNVTEPGEQELADDLAEQFRRYTRMAQQFFAVSDRSQAERRQMYISRLVPTFDRIKTDCDEVLRINQVAMERASTTAQATARSSRRWMIVGLAGVVLATGLIALSVGRSILDPVRIITGSVRAISRGELDQVVPAPSRDEMGELAEAFNRMTRSLREYRRSNVERLVRLQKATQAAIDALPDPVLVVGPQRQVELANPAAQRFLGILGADGSSVRMWEPPKPLSEPLDRVLQGGPNYRPSSFEQTFAVKTQDEERLFLPRVMAISDGSGGVLGAAITLHDMTRFRMLDQMKTDMVATVSHELKTPLTGVRMAVHLLLEEQVGPLNDRQIDLLLAARDDAERLLRIVNTLLDLTRIEQGRAPLDRQPLLPMALVQTVVANFAQEAQDHGIVLHTDIPPDLPTMAADPDRMEHLLGNLVSNAIRHTSPGGRVDLTAAVDDGSLRFRVSDTGRGIPADYIPRIFEKFSRVPGQDASGVGLGLAIAHEIAVAHGGTIQCESREGAGATFTATIPIWSGGAEGVEAGQEASPA